MAQRSKKKKTARRTAPPRRTTARMPFERRNYAVLLGAIALIVAGYVLMLVDNATNPDPVDSALSLTVAPLLLLAGYLGVGYAILTGVGDTQEDAAAPEASGETAQTA